MKDHLTPLAKQAAEILRDRSTSLDKRFVRIYTAVNLASIVYFVDKHGRSPISQTEQKDAANELVEMIAVKLAGG
jgi:hypothetical protein